MNKIKLAIIGAGSSYTPELLEKLFELRETLPVCELCDLYGISSKTAYK